MMSISEEKKCKTIEGYLVVNSEVASSNSFRDFQREINFVAAKSAAAVFMLAPFATDCSSL